MSSSKDDRNHTTSWDAGEVRREAHQEREIRPKTQKRKKKRRIHPLFAVVLWAAIVAASSMVLAGVGWLLANDFAALNKPMKEVNFQVSEDWVSSTETDEKGNEITHYDMGKVADALKEEGLIEYPWFFRIFCRVYHADEKITQGTFTLNTDMDYMALVRNMRSRSGSAVTVDVTIPEGYSVQRIIELLAENGVGSVEDLTEAAASYPFEDYDFLTGETGSASRLEGYLFPDTYNFYVGRKPELAFSAMLTNFKTKVYENEDLLELFEESEYSFSDIITIASLIERETDGTDREKIASVIYNRLENAGETNFLLQIDAALVYAAGRDITQTDYTTLDSPYNLYLHPGLPPTPIANPGIAAIRAALQPEETDYYFYVLNPEDNKHIFNETLAGHQATLAQLAG